MYEAEATPVDDNSLVKRVPVDFDYSALNWDFIKLMAQIPPYANEKYGSWSQYTGARLEGEKSCENHIIEHLRSFMLGEPYDKFDKDIGRHLAAGAYNFMMLFYFYKKFGHKPHPLKLGDLELIRKQLHAAAHRRAKRAKR